MAICGIDMIKRNKLPQNTVVGTVMSNMGLDIALRKAGGRVIKTDVGDRYVVEEMRRSGYRFGGEQSGHMIFLDHNTTGDGMLSALQVLAILQKSDKPLSELASVMTALPQVLVNVRVRERRAIKELPEVEALISAVEKRLGDTGRVLIRYSGTEPLMRIMLEGQDQAEITGMANEIASLVEGTIGEGTAGD
jgi:phosphoglucosamine mutase